MAEAPAWKASVCAQLRSRDAAQTKPFRELILHYTILLRKTQEIRRRAIALTGTPSTSGASSAELEKLKQELAESYRAASLQSKALLEFMTKNTEREAEVAQLTTQLHGAEADSKTLREQKQAADDRAAKATSTLAVVQTEVATLKAQQRELYEQIEKLNSRVAGLSKDLLTSQDRETSLKLELQRAMDMINRLNEETIAAMNYANEAKKHGGASAAAMSSSSSAPREAEEQSAVPIARKPTAVKRTLEAHTDGTNAVRFNFQGGQFFTGGGDGCVRSWDSLTGNPLRTFRGPSRSVMDLHCSLNNELVLGASGDNICWVWSTQTERIVHKLTGHQDKVMGCVLAGNDKLVSGSWDRWIKVWDLTKGFSIRSIPAESKVNDLDFGKGYKVVVSAHMDKCVRIHDIINGELVAKIPLHAGAVTSVFVSENSNCILTNGRDNMLRLVDVRYHGDPHIVQTFKDERYRNGCDWNSACVSPDGSFVCAGSSDGTVCGWNANTGKLEFALQSLRSCINAVAWHPAGHQLVAAHADKNVQIWE